MRTRSPLFVVIGLAALLLTACGGSDGPGVASLGGSSAAPTPTTGAGSQDDRALAFARCMRANGVPDFPDPQPGGGGTSFEVGGGSGGGDLNARSAEEIAALERAQQACRELLPVPELSEADRTRLQDAALAYARCMRENGLADFPDPQSDGSGMVKIGPGPGAGVSPDDPAFREADKACRHHMAQLGDPTAPEPPGGRK